MSDEYQVVWSNDALQQLASLWLAAEDRSPVNVAVTGLDEALSRQPESKGAEVAEELRRLQFGPLRVYFQIEDGQNRVLIVAVRAARSSGST
ncbi:MAG: type II toxin-antitoxin system RelE/ParE family toxin [Planctomycetota bacterium]|nr:MAG: type II toxin-antitoxin system RelE/ParE family toxin [Planctomycetota bacterium]